MRGFEPFILYNDFSTGATRCPLPRERGKRAFAPLFAAYLPLQVWDVCRPDPVFTANGAPSTVS